MTPLLSSAKRTTFLLLSFVSTKITRSMSTFPNKCLVYGATGVESTTKQLQLRPNDLLVRVSQVGLNPVDAKQVIGDKLPGSLQSLARRFVQGSTIGFEFAGIVTQDATGEYSVGDKVFGTMPPMSGALCEHIVPPRHQVCRAPSNLAAAETASLPLVGLTALQALQPHAGSSSIAIIGASGGTGHVAIQVARCLGFGTIIAVTSPRNIDFCRSLGATHTVDYTKNRVAQEIQTIAPQVDVIMDCVTSADPRDATYEYPKQLRHLCRQRYIRLGGPTFDWFRAGLEKALPIPCFGKEKLFWIRFPKSSQELAQLKQWCEEGKLKSSVAERVKFTQEDVQKAFDDILTRRVRGKLVVQVNPEDKS